MKKEIGSRKGTIDGKKVQEKGLDRNGNPRYRSEDGKTFASYEKFTPEETNEGRGSVKLTESELVEMVVGSVKKLMREMEGDPQEGIGRRDGLLKDMKRLIDRADFYYPMSDDYRGIARDEYFSDLNSYKKLINDPEFSEEERDAFFELWMMKKQFTSAQMSRSSDADALEAKYDEMYGKLFA